MTGRRFGRTLLAVGLLFALLAAGCGVRPSAVITGRSAVSGPSGGTGVYLLSDGELALVLRPSKIGPSPTLSPADTLALLAAGPTESERNAGFTSEVPAGIAPAGVTPSADQSGITVKTTVPVLSLSTLAADQIICTVAGAVASTGQGTSFAPVTLVGPDGARPPWPCPLG